MQVENRVARAGEKIAHVTADAPVARGMWPRHPGCDADVQHLVEDGDVGGAKKSANLVRGQSLFHGFGGEIAAQAMWLVVQIVRVVQKTGVYIQADQTERNGSVGKWARNHASSASTGRVIIHYRGPAGKRDELLVTTVGHSDTIARHAAIGTIKKWGGFNVVCIQRPVPVTG